MEREALKLAIQRPRLVGAQLDGLDEMLFTAAPARAVRRAIAAAGGASSGSAGQGWVRAVLAACADDEVRQQVHALAVEPIRYDGDDETRYAAAVLARLQELAVTRELVEARSRLERTNPEQAGDGYLRLFSAVVELEAQKRTLRAQAAGAW